MKKIAYLIVISLSILPVGCKNIQNIVGGQPSIEESYVVHKEISGKQKITVLQEYTDKKSDNLLKESEKVLLKLGFSVVNPPIRITVEKTSGNINAANTQQSLNSNKSSDKNKKESLKSGETIEKYYQLDQTTANYFIYIDSRQDIFKIVKKDTKEILAIENTKYISNFFTNDQFREQAYNLFTTIGFDIRKQKSNPQNKSTVNKNKFKTYKSIPEKPIFTVIQTYSGTKAKGYASKSEKMLIEVGLHIVRPPEARVVKDKSTSIDAAATEKSATSKERADNINKGNLNTDGVTETYISYDETTADHFLFIDSELNSFKIVEKETGEILAIEKLNILSDYNDVKKHREFADLLKSIGIRRE